MKWDIGKTYGLKPIRSSAFGKSWNLKPIQSREFLKSTVSQLYRVAYLSNFAI